MTSSSDPKRGFPNVPPPPGSKAGTAYTRFIPREELGSFAAWTPGEIGQPRPERRAEPRPPDAPQPTAEDWRARIAEARKAGYQDGYRDGLAALESFKQSFAQQLSAQIGQLVAAFDSQIGALEAQMAQSVARSAVLLARRVLRQELQLHPERVVPLAEEAVNAVLLSARQILVRVNPEDLPLVEQGAAEVLQARGARLVADPSVPRGGVQVDSDAGSIDAAVTTRWAQAAAALGAADLPFHDGAGEGPEGTPGAPLAATPADAGDTP